MTTCGKEILIAREGTEQNQRFLDALDPASVKLNDFGLKEWMQFAYRFAKKVNYFELNNAEIPAGDWSDFFIAENELKSFLENAAGEKKITPHLALFVSFIKLLEYTQKRFNNLTKKHLDFYYHDILKIEKLPATPDKVHLIFELAKNFVDQKIAKGTALDAGKDASGQLLIYKTTEEIIVNRTRVVALKSIYNEPSKNKIKAASVANSLNGAGDAFPENSNKWWPFGYYGDSAFPELPDAKIGFALSSGIFEMGEGLRSVSILAEFEKALNSVAPAVLENSLEVYCTGEKGWLGPFKVLPVVKDDSGNQIYASGLKSGLKKLELTFQIAQAEKAVVNYNSKIHGEYFKTSLPVCRMLIKTGNPEGYALFKNLAECKLNNLTVKIDVKGIKNLLLNNDNGVIDAAKPFFPFGTQPVRNSHFSISYPELFKKPWTKLSLGFEWKNTPEKVEASKNDSFVDRYFAYRKSFVSSATAAEYVKLIKENTGLIVDSNEHFKVVISVRNNEKWTTNDSSFSIFKWNSSKFRTQINIDNATLYQADEKSLIKLSLNQSFYHEMFPRIYALALSCEDKTVKLPNEPYTPLAENISMSYTAEQSIITLNPNSEDKSNQVILFHEHPFGQTYECSNSDGLLQNLVPEYKKGGHLFIGLCDVEPVQQISLLVQVFEGSENPAVESFAVNEKVAWSVLCNNRWKILDSESLICDETGNFLKSGIVKFALPREANDSNALLPGKLVWVQASMEKSFDVVCKVINIIAQAVRAEFANHKNETSHLANGLKENTITKMVQRLPGVKSVSQPFNSFDGRIEENDTAYYRRISERLRHKNRAITIWDYEHLILENFPDVYKVKCLNHTRAVVKNNKTEFSFLSPGHVLVVVIPDIIHKNVFDIYQPRLSKAALNAVQDYINRLNTLHVKAKVINPEYEEVTIGLKVKFYKGFDENYYQKVLNDDITKMLSPWAFQKASSLKFGLTLHRSAVVNYIEQLGYVDFVEDVNLKKGNESNLVNIVPDSPVSILVSAKSHEISLVGS